MSSAARFLLEFEATGDQEVVAKIREVGAAGKQTATDLQALQGVQDPFAEVASGAESAVAPITEVGTASAETTGLMTELGTEGTAAAEGITELGTQTEESAGKTMGFADAMGTMTGSIAAIGGSIGSLIGSFTRYNEIQLKVQKAQLTSARATEMSRKAEEGLDKVLATATGNTANIAAAREKLAQAQGEMNKLMDQGVTSGAAFEQAQSNLQAAQKNLSAEFAKGGGDISKLTTAMEKSEINSAKMVTSLNNLELALADQKKGILDMVFGFSSMAGSLVQTIGSMGKWGTAMKTASGGMKDLISWIGRGGISLAAIGTAAAGAVVALAILHSAFQVFRAIPKIFDFISGAIEGSKKKVLAATIEILEITKQAQAFSPGAFATGPIMDEAIKKLKEMAKEKKIDISTTEQQKNVYDDFEGTVKQTIADWQNMINTVTTATTGMQQHGTTSADVAKELENMDQAFVTTGQAAQTATSAIYDQTNSLANLGTVEEETAKAMEDGVVTEIEFQRIRAATIKTTKDAINSGGQLTDSIKEQMSATEGMVQSAASVEQELQNMNIGMVDVGANAGEVEKEISGLGGELVALDGTAASVEVQMKNMGTAVGDLRPAFDDAKKAANENAEANNANAQVILGMIGSIEQEQEALSEVNLAYAESEKKLADLAAVENNARATKLQLITALNEELASLKEENIALQASIAASKDAAIQAQALANAKLEGVAAAEEWIASLDEARAKEEAEIGVLKEHAAQFGEFPSVIDPTVEAYQEFIQANEDGGQAAIDFQQKVLDAYNELVSEAQPLLDDLTAAFHKSGEEQSDAMTEAWGKLLPGVENTMSGVQKSLLENLANMRAEIERGSQAFAFALQTGFEQGLDLEQATNKARGVFQNYLAEAESESNAAWSGVWDEANQIAETGSASMIEAAAKAIREGTVPAEVEKMLQDIIANGDPAGNKLGTNFATGMVSGVQQGAGAVEQELAGIQDQFVTNAANKPIIIPADISPAVQKITELENILATVQAHPIMIPADLSQAIQAVTDFENTLVSVQASPIIITADVQQAGSAIASIVSTLSSLQPPPIVLTADVQQAGNAIASIVNTLATLKPPAITVTANTTQAVSALNAASNSALTMRNNFNAASGGVKSAVASAGSAVTSFSSKASSSFTKAGTAGTQMANKVKSASSSMKSSLNSAASSAASFASKCVSSFNKVGSSATSNASKVRNLASAISRLKSKTITITTKYVTSGRPGGLQHGGAFIANNPTTIGGTKVGEHYKPELVTVTPLTNPNNLDRTVTVNTPARGGGGSREVVIPVTLMLDNKVLIRTVRRGLVEEVSGAM